MPRQNNQMNKKKPQLVAMVQNNVFLHCLLFFVVLTLCYAILLKVGFLPPSSTLQPPLFPFFPSSMCHAPFVKANVTEGEAVVYVKCAR